MDPNKMLGELMKDPEMIALIGKPHVMSAIQELQTNPDSVGKHMADPDVAKVMQKLMSIQMGSMGAQAAGGQGDTTG